MLRTYTKLCNQGIIKYLNKPGRMSKRTLLTQCADPIRNNDLLHPKTSLVEKLRYKTKTQKPSDKESDSYASDDVYEIQDKNTKILKINVASLRVDAVLKSSLGLSRNKIETLFYESKIRVNGDKIKKKSATIHEGDEIDLIKGPDIKNPNFTNIARVEILSIKAEEEDSISMKIKRCKSLAVDSYR